MHISDASRRFSVWPPVARRRRSARTRQKRAKRGRPLAWVPLWRGHHAADGRSARSTSGRPLPKRKALAVGRFHQQGARLACILARPGEMANHPCFRIFRT